MRIDTRWISISGASTLGVLRCRNGRPPVLGCCGNLLQRSYVDQTFAIGTVERRRIASRANSERHVRDVLANILVLAGAGTHIWVFEAYAIVYCGFVVQLCRIGSGIKSTTAAIYEREQGYSGCRIGSETALDGGSVAEVGFEQTVTPYPLFALSRDVKSNCQALPGVIVTVNGEE